MNTKNDVKEVVVEKATCLRFKVDGVNFKTVRENLIQLHKAVYRSEFQQDESNGFREPFVHYDMFLKIGDLFVEIESYMNKDNLENQWIKDNIKEMGENPIAKIESLARPSLLLIEAFKQANLDWQKLLSNRENHIKGLEQERLDKIEQAKREEENKRIEREKEIDVAELDFVKGEFIKGKDFVALCERHGIKIHIRTKGTIFDRIIKLNKAGRFYYMGEKYKADKMWEHIDELNAILKK